MDNQKTDPIEIAISKFKGFSVGKKVAIILMSVLILLFVLAAYGAVTNQARNIGSGNLNSPMMDVGSNDSYSPSKAVSESIPTDPRYAIGNDAENFETKNITISFETNNLDNTCGQIGALKQKSEVIFLSAVRNDTSCYYSFKVANKESVNILSQLKALNPKEINEQIETIKKQIENSLNRRDILNQNLTSTEEILSEALTAYDNLINSATLQQNATALSTAINDKMNLIDKLKQRREQTRQEIDQLNRQLAEQTDKLEYTYFSVTVSEKVYFDSEKIADSWKYTLRNTLDTLNEIVQQLTLGLVTFIMYVLLYSLYLMIIIIVAKFGWRVVRIIGKK